MGWWLRAIGVPGEIIGHLDQARVTFQHPAVLWLGGLLLVPATVYAFRRQRRSFGTVPVWLLAALTGTRTAILALLFLTVSVPRIAFDSKVEKKPIVALLFDRSASMFLPAGPFENEDQLVQTAEAAGYAAPEGKIAPETRKALQNISRAKLAQTAAEAGAEPLAASLEPRFDVRTYAFAAHAALLDRDEQTGKLPEPEAPGGPSSRIGDALGAVLDDAAGEPVSGILLFSDGRNTGGTAPPEAARRAAGLGVPVYAFAPAADSRAKDLSIIDVHSSGRVALGDLARVTVLIESHGLDKRQASVQLKEGERVVDREAVSLLGSEQQQVHLTFEATNEGPHRLTVEIPPLEGEPEYLHANNTDATHVEVTREKLRVLYVEGLPRWDFRFLKNAMRRDHGLGGRASDAPDLVLESEWQRLPPAPDGARLPASPGDLKDYHAIILGDASPQLLAPEWLAAVKEAVRERGVGLIILCGPLYMPHAYGAQLADLLPVRMHAGAAGLEAPSYRPFRPALTPEGQLHEVMRLYDEQDRNAAIWATMPPCYWCAAASRPAPGATVLASVAGVMGARGNVPLIAYHQAGEGRVLFVGTDATWRWRQNTGDRFFYRFWGQALWFVARRAQPGDAVTSLTVAPVRAQCGDEMRIELLAYAKSGEPLREERVSVGLIGPAGTDRIELIPDAGGVGRYTGRYVASVAGDYRFTFDPADGRDPVRASASVREALAEFRRPDVDRDTLRMLAEVTGGTSAALSDLASVGDELEGEPEWVEIHREAGLWDNWLTLSLLVLVYSADVGLRRMRGMS